MKILITGINIANWVGTSKEILNIYYEHIRWISKISKNPNIASVNTKLQNFSSL